MFCVAASHGKDASGEPHSLEGDAGWQMRDTYSDCMKDLDKSVCCALWCQS